MTRLQAYYVVFKYGPLGVADVQYVKLRKGYRTTWVTDRHKASFFNTRARAEAYAKGYREAGGDDLVIEQIQ